MINRHINYSYMSVGLFVKGSQWSSSSWINNRDLLNVRVCKIIRITVVNWCFFNKHWRPRKRGEGDRCERKRNSYNHVGFEGKMSGLLFIINKLSQFSCRGRRPDWPNHVNCRVFSFVWCFYSFFYYLYCHFLDRMWFNQAKFKLLLLM